MFADDTHLTYADNDVGNIESCLNVNEDLMNVYNWLNANKLTKTEFILIGSGPRLNTLTAPHQ